jgi:hypothetical protein
VADEEWREALLADKGGEGGERGGGPPSSSSSRSRAGGGLRVPRALFWDLEFLIFACESRWNGDGASFEAATAEKASGAEGEGGRHGGGAAAPSQPATAPSPSPPPPPPRAFLGEAGPDVTLSFERTLRKEVPDGTKARVRYFRRFYLRHRQQQQEQEQEQPRARDDGGGGGGIRLSGSYRPSRLGDGGGDGASRRAREELFALAFSGGAGGSGGGESRESGESGGGEEDPDPLHHAPPPPPPFSRESLALELADLSWGLFTGGEDRAERLRASRRRREAKRDE